MTERIAFIGAGNMAGALIRGLIADGLPPQQLVASDPSETQLERLQATGIELTTDNATAVAGADTIVFAVKPQQLQAVASTLAVSIQAHRPLLISIAAGVRTTTLDRWLGGDTSLVRAMPNTPAMVQSGATALFATRSVNTAQKDEAERLMRAVGLVQWVQEESLLDAVTALSGSGPAYFFLLMEALEAAGRELGLDPAATHLLTVQTALGAAKMALESDESPAMLRARVTSPGGTTERAIDAFESGGLRDLCLRALQAAHHRSAEISGEVDAS